MALLPHVSPARAAEADALDPDELKNLDLEELTELQVTTASKKVESRFETPAAIHVITGDEIRRSGVTSLAGALRLAPGVQVSRINSNQWAIGIRGFASRLSRSMLVLVDGRSVYTPLFAGTYWEVQDTLLEDLDRIEVIRGPGGTLWGANAVNGIVNIITKSSRETQGALVTGGGGTEERGFGGVRYGGRVGEATTYRVYAKYFDRDAAFTPGFPDFDDWYMGQGGFRADSDVSESDALTIQGDYYAGEAGQRTSITRLDPPSLEVVRRDSNLAGGNFLARWTHAFENGSESSAQLYYDRTERRDPNFEEDRDTFDAELNHRSNPFERHDVVWGLGYRVSADDTGAVPTLEFVPHGRTLHLVTGFLEDEITIVTDRLRLKLGSKFEHNDYTEFEAQPSGRLVVLPTRDQAVWAAVSRAVRTPSRVERDLFIDALLDPTTPTFARLIANDGFDSEELLAYELGYRIRPVHWAYASLSLFYNDYENLLSVEAGAPSAVDSRTVVPLLLRNGLEGESYGFELATDAYPTAWLQIHGSYSYLELELDRKPGSVDATTARTTEGSAPHHQVSMRFFIDLPRDFELDSVVRYVDNLPALRISSYVAMDARVGWRPTESIELSIVGQNLFDDRHPEFRSGAFPATEIERGGYAKVTCRF